MQSDLPKATDFNFGDIRGSVLDFEKAGDTLPKHTHDEDTVHMTIVAKGRLKAFSHDWSEEYECGKVIDFPPFQPHELVALEDNTRIINILKKYKPKQ